MESGLLTLRPCRLMALLASSPACIAAGKSPYETQRAKNPPYARWQPRRLFAPPTELSGRKRNRARESVGVDPTPTHAVSQSDCCSIEYARQGPIQPVCRDKAMKQLFADPLFQMCAERAMVMMTRGGAEYGECASTASKIISGDVDSWYREWIVTAERVENWGDDSARRGHIVSAREAYLRSSTYYRTSYCPLFGAPTDPRLVVAFDRA